MTEPPSKDAPPTRDNKRKENVLEVLDELIFHMNTTRSIFRLLILSSFILAPLSLIVAMIVVVHPGFLALLMRRLPEVGVPIIVLIGVSVLIASVWLYIGAREHRFFSRWNNKFQRYMSLKSRIDKELGDDTSPSDGDPESGKKTSKEKESGDW